MFDTKQWAVQRICVVITVRQQLNCRGQWPLQRVSLTHSPTSATSVILWKKKIFFNMTLPWRYLGGALHWWFQTSSGAGCSRVSWNVGAQFDAGAAWLYAEVCVFLLCHNDDVATMRTGASSRPPSAMLNMCDQSSQLRNSESQGLLGSGINQWEETAEACVASAHATQHSHTLVCTLLVSVPPCL